MNKNYTNYDAIDFAEEPSFIRWVKGEDLKASAFWEEWEVAHPSKKAELREAKVLIQSIQIKEEEPSTAQIQNLWAKIDAATPTIEQINTEKQIVAKKEETAVVQTLGRRKWINYAAAACIGLIAFFYFYNPMTTVSVGSGEHLAYTLPDNSTIQLNAASTIHFKENSFKTNRVVNLEGEAFFEVEKGASFKVITPKGTIEVLGTSFNVNTRNEGLAVDCRSGKVKVTANGSANSEILTKGEGTKLNDNQTALETKTQTNISQKIGWIDGDYYFTNVPFSKVMEALERQYDIAIDCDSSLQSRIGDYTFKGNNLEKALADVSFQLNAKEPVITGRQVKIRAK